MTQRMCPLCNVIHAKEHLVKRQRWNWLNMKSYNSGRWWRKRGGEEASFGEEEGYQGVQRGIYSTATTGSSIFRFRWHAAFPVLNLRYSLQLYRRFHPVSDELSRRDMKINSVISKSFVNFWKYSFKTFFPTVIGHTCYKFSDQMRWKECCGLSAGHIRSSRALPSLSTTPLLNSPTHYSSSNT